MNKKSIQKNKLIIYILIALLLIITCFGVYSLFYDYFTISNINIEKWDGVSISKSFKSGNGTIDNPYTISNGEDLTYFKSLIEGPSSASYNDKYYILTNNINMGNKPFSSIGKDKNHFKGTLDGNGFTISDIEIISNKYLENESYGLFSYINNATIKNLNIQNIIIEPLENKNINLVGTLASIVDTNNNISNISLKNIKINLSKIESNKENKTGLLASIIKSNNILNNIYINGEFVTSYTDNVGYIANTLDSNIDNIVTLNKSEKINYFISTTNKSKLKNHYVGKENNFNTTYELNNKEVSPKEIINKLNKNNKEDFRWEQVENDFVINKIVLMMAPTPKPFAFGTTQLPLHESGIVGDTLYINDLDSDYNNFIGLNYTYPKTELIPNGNNQNIYNESNLVKIYIQYNGTDIRDSNLKGYVSLTEKINKINYYKYYPVVDGYVEIELIDLPFANRPNDKAFYGWATKNKDVDIRYEKDIHTYIAKIPVNDVTKTISIVFNACWNKGFISKINNNETWNNALSMFPHSGIYKLGKKIVYESVANYYVKRKAGFWYSFPSGAIDQNGESLSGSCRKYRGCPYFIKSPNDVYQEGEIYYDKNKNGKLVQITVPSRLDDDPNSDIINLGDAVGGYYKLIKINPGTSYNNLYDKNANYIASGKCNNQNGCELYQLLPYVDSNGQIVVAQENEVFGKLISRDSNIVVLSGTNSRDFSTNKAITITGINNGSNFNGRYDISNFAINLENDMRIEHIMLTANTSRSDYEDPSGWGSNSSGYIYGNGYNLKIGRGIRKNENRNTATNIIGGNNGDMGSSGNVSRYKMIIESGVYNNTSAINGTTYYGTANVDVSVIYGSDIDRIQNNNNDLDIYKTAAGSWGSNIYGRTSNDFAIYTIVKSGKFGTSKSDYTTGIYVGGLNSGKHYAMRGITVEGGYIYNLLGGPLSANTRNNKNDIFMNIKGGSIDYIIGGAGVSETYGNRIINATGGTINYAIFGGSNGYSGSDSQNNRGTLKGNTLVYVGGNTVVGSDEAINQNRPNFGEEIGSVFGIGNGKSEFETIGTANNSKVIIDGKAVIKNNVYGGGNYGAVGIESSSASTTDIKILGGTINGSVYGGGNNSGSGSTTVKSTITIDMTAGNVLKSIYGGSKNKGIVYGSSNVNILGGNIKNDIYGGGQGGKTNQVIGTYISENAKVNIGNKTTGPTVEGSIYGGSAYGTVNGTNGTTNGISKFNTNVIVENGLIKGSVFGGGKGSNTLTPYVMGNVNVDINGGNISNVFGGNDASGSPNGTVIVNLNGGTIGNAFGGGNQTAQKNTDIRLNGAKVTNVFGGSNLSGTVDKSLVTIKSGTATNIYGGNNSGGLTKISEINGINGTITGDIYGGGKEAPTDTSNVTLGKLKINNVYGGGEKADCANTNITINETTGNKIFGGSNIQGTVDKSNIIINGCTFNSTYGGNNAGGKTNVSNITMNNGIITDLFGGGEKASSTESNINIKNGIAVNIYGGGNEAGLNKSNITISGGNLTNIYGGSNKSGNLTSSNIVVEQSPNINIANIYGGNNQGGFTDATNLLVKGGVVQNVYGGGNLAEVSTTNVVIKNATLSNLFGGGNFATVKKNTHLDIDSSVLKSNVYGGGNEGQVIENTEVFITNSKITGSIYAGGNGAPASVSGNTTVTLDGKTIVGNPNSKAPNAGCVFGGGNAAVTGESTKLSSKATVNIVGGTIYGNVYGGANTSIVYGATDTNIGKDAVNINNLLVDDIIIKGTVFGGGESNAEGKEEYDYEFKSVIGSIDININGTGYITNNKKFMLTGSIFGSGNASSSEGSSKIYVKKLGEKNNPSKNISFQRTNELTIDNSYMELEGITDRTNEYSDILYSFNQIDSLVIKNNTTLLLQRNANLLKELYSGVDVNGKLVPATVTIDDKNKTVTKNVDNRIYMLANRNLNVTTNQSATAYGRVTGMTFFGMYNKFSSGSFGYGVYDSSVNYGDAADAGDAIIGGSYVLGLHSVNHDITKDGFYTNILSDDFTNVITEYIDPLPKETNFFRWVVGMNAINYEVNLTATKYSSLGTYNLSLLDFAKGDTIFNVIGFNSEGLGSNIQLVDSNEVPRVTNTAEEANKTIGLAMKTETREWTSYGTTKLIGAGGGQAIGDKTYVTDSQPVAPSFMFYLYHAKNITLDANLGTVIVTLQALVPKNEIEYEVQYITITVNIIAKNYSDGNSYDASITYDKKYEMPSATDVNITNQSQFTAYYSLFAQGNNMRSIYGTNNTNYHALTSSYALPIGTQITMIDYGYDHNNPQYYYFDITKEVYDKSVIELNNYNEITYRLSDFIKMGSTSKTNNYNDKDANNKYYQQQYKRAIEEFVFIFDFKNTTTTGQHLNNSILLELRSKDNRALITVLSIRQTMMKYNLYDTSNVVLEQKYDKINNYIHYNVPIDFALETNVAYDQTGNRDVIIDTNYESSSMGLNIRFYDSSGNDVSSSLLSGTVIKMGKTTHFADGYGVYRIKLANKVSNLKKQLTFIADKKLPTGKYQAEFILFSSPDGIHNSNPEKSSIKKFDFYIIGDNNAISIVGPKENKLVNGTTGLNQLGKNVNVYNLLYKSVLSKPNVRVSLYKRNIDTENTTEYTEIDFNQVFKNTLLNSTDKGYISKYKYEKMIDASINNNNYLKFEFVDKLTSGTYKLVFKLYDRDQLIEEQNEYIIIKKDVVSNS